jgi:uncharacterized FAD-dependent dehydrogenase
MIKEVEVRIDLSKVGDEEHLYLKGTSKLFIDHKRIKHWEIHKRSIDARQRKPVFVYRLKFFIDEEPPLKIGHLASLSLVKDRPEVLIIGAGPAGYFAALELIELGLRPILFEQGKDVRARRKDLKSIQQDGYVNDKSNYCFGEGGAGTYSDGKLYTRSHKRGKIIKVLELLVEHGAKTDILIDAHPHIGSNKLPQIVQNIRLTIEKFGGEIHFDSTMTDILIKDGKCSGVVINHEKEYHAEAMVLATGHSARSVYELLDKKGVHIESKPFALGVRIEHPQRIIDEVQYSTGDRGEHLPAASYSLACQVDDRGVFSFCMCPGGLVVPAATAPGEIVVNGMSLSRRDSPFANAGTVVAVEKEDLAAYEQHGKFAGLAFQQAVEQKMFAFGDGSQRAPAQRLTDFVKRKISTDLGPSSYIPTLYSAPMHELLPKGIYARLRQGVLQFGKMMKGYYTEQANVIGVESRTSSPIKIPRNKGTFMHENAEGLFPCGEGAGYAGGIVSAAMDGQNVAKAVARFLIPTAS